MTFTVTTPSPAFTVSSSGHVSALNTLAVGSYTVSGDDTDSCSNTGTWTYTLTVTPGGHPDRAVFGQRDPGQSLC